MSEPPFVPPSYGGPQLPFPASPPDHPKAMTVLVLGIVGHVLCGITSPFAWVMGARARREIAASNGQLGGHTQVTVGWVMGIVGTVELALVAAYLLFVVILVASGLSQS